MKGLGDVDLLESLLLLDLLFQLPILLFFAHDVKDATHNVFDDKFYRIHEFVIWDVVSISRVIE